MKNPISSVLYALLLATASAMAADGPPRISVAPKNDLSVLAFTPPRGSGFGSAVCGAGLSKEYEEGHRIGSRNNHYGMRNILAIDDGQTVFPITDEATGLPIIVLTNVRLTEEFRDLVKGYNSAMRSAVESRKKDAAR